MQYSLWGNYKKMDDIKIQKGHEIYLQRQTGIKEKNVSNSTVRRCLNKQGYGFMQCRKKGLLYPDNLSKRVKFACKCKRLSQAFWKEGVSFLLGWCWIGTQN